VDLTAAIQLTQHDATSEQLSSLECQRILIIMTTPLGDTLFAGPAIHALRRRYPSAHIAALGLPTNATILRQYKDLNEVIVYQNQTYRSAVLDFIRLITTLRRRSFDLSVEMTPVGLTFTLGAGIPERVGFGFQALWWLLPNRSPDWKRRHAVFHYGDLVHRLGAVLTSGCPELQISDTHRIDARAILAEHHVGDSETLITVHPGASTRLKQWHPKRFAELIDRLSQRPNVRVALVGGGSDLQAVRAIQRLAQSKPLVLAGTLSVLQTAAVQQHAALHIGNDSGPLHLAVAVGTPTVGLFGPTNPNNFQPLGAGASILHKPLPCSPCTHFVGGSPILSRPLCRTCGCLDQLDVDEVEAISVKKISRAMATGRPYTVGDLALARGRRKEAVPARRDGVVDVAPTRELASTHM